MLVTLRMGGEDGSIAVVGAIALVVFSMLGAALLHIGDVALHRRHLQLQTDAAVLAAAQGFSACINDPGNALTKMTAAAAQYGGFGSGTYNQQVQSGTPTGGTVNAGYNDTAYPSPSTHAPDNDGGDLTTGADPCTAGIFDVKAVEPNVTLLGVFHTEVNAHSAVELRTAGSVTGLLPLAVPDPRFNYAFATFIDESTGNAVAGCASGCTVQLQKNGLDASGNQIWASPTATTVPIVKNVGLRFRLVGGSDSTAACGTQQVACFTDASTTNQGLVHIRGWNGGTAPQAHNVWLLSGTCSSSGDAYFTTADCSAGIQAQLDFGSVDISTVTVTASIAGGGTVTLTPASSPISGSLYLWTSLNGLAITGPGAHIVSLNYAIAKDTKCKTNNPCLLETAAQRAYEGSTDVSGPIQVAQVSDASGAGANSFQIGATPSLNVGLITSGSLQAKAAASSPLVTLRLAGSQSQSFDCDPAAGSNLAVEIAKGCAPKYTIDTDPNLACPAYNVLWNTAQPWPCVKTQTGGSVGQVETGLSDRILAGGTKCPTGTYGPIHWPYDQSKYPSDPRVVSLIITPFGAFSGTGNAVYPVIDFGTFYITGWDKDPCAGAVTSVAGGDIVGHFIKYVSPVAPTPSTTHCYFTDPNQITPCVAVLTR